MQTLVHRLRLGTELFAIIAAFACIATDARATVMISSGATKNMACSSGVCAPTAANPILNVTQLEGLLASSNVKVATGRANNINVSAALTWTSSNTLTLDAAQSISIISPISVNGPGGLALVTNDGGTGGTLSFGVRGRVTFASVSDSLTINGAVYTLVDNIASIESIIAANYPTPDNIALAASYNATGDGTYTSSPVSSIFLGNFEGLGNTISNLKIVDHYDTGVGLFIQDSGEVRDLGLLSVNITAGPNPYYAIFVGALAGSNTGSIINCFATGRVSGSDTGGAGGLVGDNSGGSITGSAAVVIVHATGGGGGLVGFGGGGSITNSYATGTVSASGDATGGLVGGSEGTSITNSYATGSVTGPEAYTGGLLGYIEGGSVQTSYSTGAVSGLSSIAGGFVGEAFAGFVNDFGDCDWDTDASGITDLSQGAGYPANEPGIAGLTTVQLQSGLPSGFDPTIWGEKANINGGFPYLLANPPR